MAKETIIVVDDDQMDRWSLAQALRGWGYEVAEAKTVAEAISAYENEQPAAVLPDITRVVFVPIYNALFYLWGRKPKPA